MPMPASITPHKGDIIVIRPLEELGSYITHGKMPPVSLLIRVVKTCVMSFFRWHLYDQDQLLVVIDAQTQNCVHTWDDGLMKMESILSFWDKHEIVMENARCFALLTGEVPLNAVDITRLKSLSVVEVVRYYQSLSFFKDKPLDMRALWKAYWVQEISLKRPS